MSHEFDDDTEFDETEVVYLPAPRRFEKPVLFLPPLILLSSVARGVQDAADLMIQAVSAHLEYDRDMSDFQVAAALEIETIVVGDEDA